jgi:hypothetical protein
MNKLREPVALAEKLSTKATFEISATDVKEFDPLMVEIKKKQAQYITFSLDITCKWEYGYDIRTIKFNHVSVDEWDRTINRIRTIESQVIKYLNEFPEHTELNVIPIFSCTAKLHIEYKDKEAQKKLEDNKQMYLFTPRNIDEIKYSEILTQLVEDMKPDGENIKSVTLTRI